MQNQNLKLVKLKRSVLGHKSKHQLVNDVIEVCNTIHNVDNLKRDPEFLLFVCNLVENADKQKDINKKEIVLDVFKTLFAELNNDYDLKQIGDMIEFLYSNKRIKKISKLLSVASSVMGWVAKKFL